VVRQPFLLFIGSTGCVAPENALERPGNSHYVMEDIDVCVTISKIVFRKTRHRKENFRIQTRKETRPVPACAIGGARIYRVTLGYR